MDPVTIYYCDTSSPIRYIQVTNVHPPLKVGRFVTVIGRPPFFTWIVTGRPLLLLSEMWMFCHRSPGSAFACLKGGGQNVTMVFNQAFIDVIWLEVILLVVGKFVSDCCCSLLGIRLFLSSVP